MERKLSDHNPDIQAAFDAWIVKHPNPDEELIAVGFERFSAREVVEAYRTGHETIRKFVNAVPAEDLIKSLSLEGSTP